LIADILKIIAKGAFYLIRIIFQVTLVVLAVYFMSGIITGNPQEQEGLEGLTGWKVGCLCFIFLSCPSGMITGWS
jgi:hypothetical protein